MQLLPSCWWKKGAFVFTILSGLVVLWWLVLDFRLPAWRSDLDRLRDAGMLRLAQRGSKKEVVSANLSGESVTNATLRSLQSCPALETLNLSSSRIDDDGLHALEGLTSLRSRAGKSWRASTCSTPTSAMSAWIRWRP